MKQEKEPPQNLKIGDKLVRSRKDMGRQIREALKHKDIRVPAPLHHHK